MPEYMKNPFASNGIDTEKILYAIHTDLAADGGFADAYVAVDEENLYILYGVEKVVKTQGAKRIVAAFEEKGLTTFKLSGLKELKTERQISTGRLYNAAQKDGESGEWVGEDELILTFSVGFLSQVERLCKVIKNLADGEEPLKDVKSDDDLFCPKCGTRYPEPERKLCLKCMDKRNITARLMAYFKYYKKKVALVVFAMVLGTGFQILSPYVSTVLLFDEVLTDGDRGWYGYVGLIVLAILVTRVMGVLMGVFHSIVLAKTMPWIIYDLKMRIFEAMQRLSIKFYTSKRTGSVMNRVDRDASNIYWFFVDGLPYILVNLMMFIGVITLMFIMHWQLALISILSIPITIILFRTLWGLFRRFHHRFWVYDSQLNSMVGDSINGQRVIKAFAREREEGMRFGATGLKQANVEISSMNLAVTAFPLINFFMFMGQIAVTIVGGIFVIEGDIPFGVFMAFIAYLTMLYGPLEFLSWVSNWWARCVDSAQRVFEVIDSQPEITEPDNPVIVESLNGDIELNNVWFEYEPAVPVLKGLTLTAYGGKMLGIVGKTGAGKSTMANLIARLYDVSEGGISIGGVNVKELPLAQLRQNIGVVSQEIYLFIGSIMDNIRYAKPESSVEDVIKAAKAASAHDFIMNLPDGYETRVGAGGQDLSGGEKQRLSIARTIIQNPQILILDEATAAMDTETEGKIQAALHKLQEGRTTIAIAHRLSTLKDADRLCVISEGKVVEEGTHEELIIKKGEYHKLYNIQMEGLKVINMD